MGYGDDTRYVLGLRHSSSYFNVTLTVTETGFLTLTQIPCFLPLISSYPGHHLLLHGLCTWGCLDDVVEFLWVGVEIVELP